MVALIHILLFTSYLLTTRIIFKKVPESISETYYLFDKKRGFLFTLWMMSMGVTSFFYPSVWLMISGIFLCFTAVAAQYKDRITNVVHYIGAVGGYLFACFEINIFFIGALPILAFLLRDIKNKTYWIEVGYFFIITTGLIIKFNSLSL